MHWTHFFSKIKCRSSEFHVELLHISFKNMKALGFFSFYHTLVYLSNLKKNGRCLEILQRGYRKLQNWN